MFSKDIFAMIKMAFKKKQTVDPSESQDVAEIQQAFTPKPMPSLTNGTYDWDMAGQAENGLYCYSHAGEWIDNFAVGKDGWMPVFMAGCTLLQPWEDTQFSYGYYTVQPGTDVLGKLLSLRIWMGEKDKRIGKWLDLNNEAIRAFIHMAASADFVPEKFSRDYGHAKPVEYGPSRMAEIYLAAREMANPPMLDRSIVLCDGIGGDYWESPVMQTAREANKQAHGLTEALFMDWFEVRGFAVDREQKLIAVENYKALFVSAELDI